MNATPFNRTATKKVVHMELLLWRRYRKQFRKEKKEKKTIRPFQLLIEVITKATSKYLETSNSLGS